jgi:hypothetical protein
MTAIKIFTDNAGNKRIQIRISVVATVVGEFNYGQR